MSLKLLEFGISNKNLFVLFLLVSVNCFNFGNCAFNSIKPSELNLKNSGTNPFDYEVRQLSAEESLNARNRVFRQVNNVRITGFRLDDPEHEIKWVDGTPSVLSDTDFYIRIFGDHITQDTLIAFTELPHEYGHDCVLPATKLFKPIADSVTSKNALYMATLPALTKTDGSFYICAKNGNTTTGDTDEETKNLVHQGKDIPIKLRSHQKLLPLWISLIVIIFCLGFSALFSGLNLGLMALDRTELKILCNTGSEKERRYARMIKPVRDKGNYLLCSILLGNVLVNCIFTILMDGLTSGLFAVVFSTMAIVIFGEIAPQAICSRHGLAVGAKTIIITKLVMLLTTPVSYPVSKILDLILGEEIGNVYNRERLKELVKVTNDINDLDKNEVNIISGALELRKKTVADVMTHIDDAFMLSLDAVLDFETVSEIMKSGYSRIPVYDGDRRNIVTLLYIKDLAFVDTDDNTPLKTLCEFYQNPVHFVFEDYTLDVMFNQFKDGTFGHLAFVHRVNNEGDGDPFYETIGLVTLEDVIEELIQAEIIDETDVFVDNRTKIRRHRSKKQDFTVFAERRENQTIRISPQLTLATFQYLSASVDAFKKDIISEQILRRLLNQDVIHNIKCKGKDKDDLTLYIYQQGKAVDFFVLILEGRVEVRVGRESLLFESGPFTYFGTQALVPNIVLDSPSSQTKGSIQSLNMESKMRQTFVPDYSVRATTDVIYIAIKRSLYLTAKKATLLEKTRKSGAEPSGEAIDDEVEKLLHSIQDDDRKYKNEPRVDGSRATSPSINDVSQRSHSFIAATQPNSQGSNSADIIDAVSLNSQVTSEPAIELNFLNQNAENQQATQPLLGQRNENDTDNDNHNEKK